jgi:hypothetical protein
MKILRKDIDQNLIINGEEIFQTDLGWQESAAEMEKETLDSIINPAQNFETVRYVHKPYLSNSLLQTDIWYKFYFISGNTYVLDYEPTGLSVKENVELYKQVTESFFRLEFYKTPNGVSPNRGNRRLVFSKNLSIPLGERYFYTPLNTFLYKPIFYGSNYRNKENMYLFWFQDNSALNEETLTGNTFYMTAKFFNAEDGTVTDFTNKPFISGFTTSNSNIRIGTRSNPILFYEKGIPNATDEIVEEDDMYFCVKINRQDSDYGYVYQVGCINDCTLGGTAVKV